MTITARGFDLSQLGQEIKNEINEAHALAHITEKRTYLGASIMGHECSAYLWFSFRWGAEPEQVDGRMSRLFDRGHREEPAIVKSLKLAGWRVSEFDPVASEQAGKPVQWRFSSVGGHFGGSCDAKLEHDRYIMMGLGTMLGEFKTHSTKNFVNVFNKGVALAMPKHTAQMSIYGYKLGLHYGLYYPVNKNDDDIEPEVIQLHHSEGELYERKAADIITAQIRPEKVSKTPTYQTCKKCPYREPCHHGAPLMKSCRSCHFASPVDGGQWQCGKYGRVIPADFMPKGCDFWVSIINS